LSVELSPVSAGPAHALPKRACRFCAHFRDDPDYLESVLPGLSSLSSARASVRAADGLCLYHDRFVSARSDCADFEPQAR
jgi:hypothetical protein